MCLIEGLLSVMLLMTSFLMIYNASRQQNENLSRYLLIIYGNISSKHIYVMRLDRIKFKSLSDCFSILNALQITDIDTHYSILSNDSKRCLT